LVDRLLAPGTPSISLHCQVADSAGPVQIEWFRNGAPLVPLLLGEQDRDRFKLNGNELSIRELSKSDSAIYQCLASNEVIPLLAFFSSFGAFPFHFFGIFFLIHLRHFSLSSFWHFPQNSYSWHISHHLQYFGISLFIH
jgi:hypothetical protein